MSCTWNTTIGLVKSVMDGSEEDLVTADLGDVSGERVRVHVLM